MIRFAAPLLLACALLAGCAAPSGPTASAGGSADSGSFVTSRGSGQIRLDFDQATELLRQGEYQKGLDVLDRLLRDKEARQNAAIQVNRGIAYARLGKQEQAEEAFKAALAIEPGHPVANNEYGMVLRRAGRFAEARAAYEKALDSYPGFLPARRNLGILCDLYLGDKECAMTQYQAYAAAVPEDKAVATWIADLQQKMNK
jgi:Tfp pilus assembly protein PilF